MKDYQLDGNKEMVALGTMNLVGSLTSCYVATGEDGGVKMVLNYTFCMCVCVCVCVFFFPFSTEFMSFK